MGHSIMEYESSYESAMPPQLNDVGAEDMSDSSSPFDPPVPSPSDDAAAVDPPALPSPEAPADPPSPPVMDNEPAAVDDAIEAPMPADPASDSEAVVTPSSDTETVDATLPERPQMSDEAPATSGVTGSAVPAADATPDAATETDAAPSPAEAVPPVDDIFSQPNVPSEDTFSPAAADEVSQAPLMEMPIESPPESATEQPLDDLFGPADTGATPDVPATPDGDAIEVPQDQDSSLDNLFDDAPAMDPAPAADSGLEDLFGAPAADDSAPSGAAEKPADEGGLNDLFGDPEPTETDSSLENLFDDPPADEPNNETSSDDLDDLFGMPGSPQGSDDNASSIDDLFGARSAPQDAAPAADGATRVGAPNEQVLTVSLKPEATTSSLDRTHVRTWIDNTGVFRTEGRLLELGNDHVRLLKTNGNTCTVPKRRMSPADLAYVDSIANEISADRVALAVERDER